MSHRVTIRYADGARRDVAVESGETVLDAADAHGAPIVSECRAGVCGTCVGRCTSGRYEMGRALALSRQEREQGWILACQARPLSDCVVEIDYPAGERAPRIVTGEATLTRIERLSPSAALIGLDLSALQEKLTFVSGQFAELQVPRTSQWRSYSFAHAPRAGDIELLVRLLPHGEMSDYLRRRARVGDRLGIRGAKGGFVLRAGDRPVALIAGGTGLSAVLALAEQLTSEQPQRPVQLYYGATAEDDLVLLNRLEDLGARHPRFRWQTIVQEPSPNWRGRIGVVTDLLDPRELHGGEVDVYACGPVAMIDACRGWLRERGLGTARFYCERFTPSGRHPVARAAGRMTPPPASLARGAAVVIGGSIAGMAAAKVLTEHFSRVIVLEKDSAHRRTEARPGAAQGWHLHHLLIAGQRRLDSIFPGVIDDMVRAGAFRVDMGEQYRIMLAGSWKRVGPTGIDIVCAGRPLLEWCVRRRLDAEPAIEYRYGSEVIDLVVDGEKGAVTGVVVSREGQEEILAAELVVDAAGKNTPVPALLEKLGAAPEVEEDCVNCFYSSMQHRVPPERAWRDKVMVICYAHRPQQQFYAAQYYTDRSRTTLSTSLVGYDCHRPPRDAGEFREFARLMPSHVVGRELDGLEPCSPVYNFRYPEMRRHRYEDLARPPGGLIAIGDAYCSVDPVSGAGMTKAMLELDELRELLRERRFRGGELAKRYYARVRRIADRLWLMIREQNLRYPWIEGVARKRPFYFRLHNWYVDRVFEALHEDAEVHRRYLEVTHLVRPPAALLRPRVMARVLGHWAKTRATLRGSLIAHNFANGGVREWGAELPESDSTAPAAQEAE
ncbi:MAG TPA: 2Fe-2S iron-sulfur cluster-binding protein [Myxococcota bacterium]|nr:2Fe-2S iron-sulfur cluster-binding protein [Myxococcota bacterium]